jgi:hypothetical protein
MKALVPVVALAAAPFVCLSVPTCVIVGGAPVAREAIALDDETILVEDEPTRRPDGSINALIEIPPVRPPSSSSMASESPRVGVP